MTIFVFMYDKNYRACFLQIIPLKIAVGVIGFTVKTLNFVTSDLSVGQVMFRKYIFCIMRICVFPENEKSEKNHSVCNKIIRQN